MCFTYVSGTHTHTHTHTRTPFALTHAHPHIQAPQSHSHTHTHASAHLTRAAANPPVRSDQTLCGSDQIRVWSGRALRSDTKLPGSRVSIFPWKMRKFLRK